MTEDITSLQIRIMYDSIDKAESRLRKLEGTGGKATKSFKDQEGAAAKLMRRLGLLAASYISLRGIISGFRAIIRTTSEFQQLNAQLVTATGSAENAAEAFAAIRDFAQTTPYDLQQVTSAFISLVNRGLTPSERALRAYGDIASSMSMELSEMVLAVSNATTGQFMNLRRLGVIARNEGDVVKFTFRGITTEVKNNAQAIEEYFMQLGEKDFAGGMERQMATLKGAFSNVGDAWAVMLNEIGSGTGLADIVEKNARRAISAIEEFTAKMESGEIEASVRSQTIQWQELGGTIKKIFDDGVQAFREMVDQSAEESGTFDQYWDDVFKNFPNYINAAVQMGLAHLNYFVGEAMLIGARLDNFKFGFNNFLTDTLAKAGSEEAKERAQNIINERIKNRALESGYSPLGGGPSSNTKTTSDDLKRELDERMDEITRNSNKLKRESDRLRAEAQERRAIFDYDKMMQEFNSGGDRTSKFRTGANAEENELPSTGGGRSGGGAANNREWKMLEESLRDQETLISESYNRRLALIRENTRAGSAYQAELEMSLTEKYQEEQQRRIDLLKQQPETYREAMAEELAMLRDLYEERKDIILSATETTELEKQELLERLNKSHGAQIARHYEESLKMQLDSWATHFNDLAMLGEAFGRRGFEIAKAASMANAIVAAIEGGIQSYKAGERIGGPTVGAAFAAVSAAAHGAQLNRLASTKYAGAYAIGGAIPPGQFGLVGEAGPELVKGPAMVTSAQATWDRRGAASAPQAGNNVEINIVNMSGEPVSETRHKDGDKEMIQFIIGQVSDKIANDISKGGTRVARSMESTYNLGRGKRA